MIEELLTLCITKKEKIMKTILRKGMAACAAVLMGANVMAQENVFVEKTEMAEYPVTYFMHQMFAANRNEKLILYVEDAEGNRIGFKVVNQDLETEVEIIPSTMGLELGTSIQIIESLDDNGNWVETNKYESNNDLRHCYYYSVSSNESSTATITQTLFNSDDKYELIVPIYGGEVINQRESNYRYKYINYVATELKVISQSGEVLQTLSAGEGKFFQTRDSGLRIIAIGEKIYLLVGIGNLTADNNSEWYYRTDSWRWYEICKETNSINFVRETRAAMNIAPTIAERDTQITITLNDDNNGVARELVVTSVNGQLVERRGIPAGENTVKVSAAMMRSGMYNFTLQKKGQVVDNGKVIVK